MAFTARHNITSTLITDLVAAGENAGNIKSILLANVHATTTVSVDLILNNNFKLASSNIPKISILNQKGINVKDLITYDKIFIEQKSISEISKRLLWKTNKK